MYEDSINSLKPVERRRTDELREEFLNLSSKCESYFVEHPFNSDSLPQLT